jgi:hypothetical protein
LASWINLYQTHTQNGTFVSKGDQQVNEYHRKLHWAVERRMPNERTPSRSTKNRW